MHMDLKRTDNPRSTFERSLTHEHIPNTLRSSDYVNKNVSIDLHITLLPSRSDFRIKCGHHCLTPESSRIRLLASGLLIRASSMSIFSRKSAKRVQHNSARCHISTFANSG